jgi:hypothetical protein
VEVRASERGRGEAWLAVGEGHPLRIERSGEVCSEGVQCVPTRSGVRRLTVSKELLVHTWITWKR